MWSATTIILFADFSSDGLSGGLALFWHDQVCVEIQDINERYMRMSVSPLMHPNGALLVFMVNHTSRTAIICGIPSVI
jgi:hypothetical protein